MSDERGGAAVDERLSPVGLTRLLGSYDAGHASILVIAALVAGARAAVLLFLAPLVGRATERAASSRLPEVAAEVAAHDTAVLDSEAPASYEIAGCFGAGRHILSVTKNPFRDAAGKSIGSLGFARDITAQRRLQAESTRFFELSGDMLCTVDFDGRLHRVNGEWEKRLGWTPAELLGSSIFDYTPPEDHPAMSAATRAARVPGARGGRVANRWRAKDGSWHWIDWSLRTVDEDRMVYASGRDVTQELLAERALASSEGRYPEACPPRRRLRVGE